MQLKHNAVHMIKLARFDREKKGNWLAFIQFSPFEVGAPGKTAIT